MIQTVTVNPPFLYQKSKFLFKEPFLSYLNNKLNTNVETIELTVVGITTLKDIVTTNNIDAYSNIYYPANISEVQYNLDASNNTPVVTFQYNRDYQGLLFRVPLSFIASTTGVNGVTYKNRQIIINFENISTTIDLKLYENDLKEFIQNRYGLTSNITYNDYGEGQIVPYTTHETNETIRINSITINETIELLYNKLKIAYDDLKAKYINLLNRP